MGTRSTDALKERVAWLEVLLGGPIDSEDGHTIFERLQTLTEEVFQLESRVGD